jgi:hypothetical protein
MTPIHTYANPPTRRGPAARVSASARPVPTALASSRRSGPARVDPMTTTVLRGRLTVTLLAVLAMIALLVTASPAVLIPIMTFLITALFVGGAFLVVERLTRPRPDAPDRPGRLTREDAR